MADAITGDPYYAVRDEIQGLLTRASRRYGKWQHLLREDQTGESLEVMEEQDRLFRDIQRIEEELDTVAQTLEVVQRQRSRPMFKHIDDEELGMRNRFVERTRQTLKHMQSEMQHARQRRKAELAQEKEGRTSRGAAMALGRRVAGAVAAGPSRSHPEAAYRVGASGSEADSLMSTHRTRQQELKARQDEDLDALHQSVTRLHGVSTTIGEEIETQGQMVEELESDVVDAHDAMARTMNGIGKLLKTKDKCQVQTVFLLVIVLIVMVILVVIL